MDNDRILIEDYLNTYHYVIIHEVKLNDRGLKDDSFLVKSKLGDDEFYKGGFIKEISMIFGDVDDERCVGKKIAEEWYNLQVRDATNEANETFDLIKNYFNDNVVMKLGPRNWQTYDKDGNIFVLQKALMYFDDLEINWMSTYIIRHFYDIWYQNEVLAQSEKIMGIS